MLLRLFDPVVYRFLAHDRGKESSSRQKYSTCSHDHVESSFYLLDLFRNMWTHKMERRFGESTTPSHSTDCNTWKSMYGSEGEHVDKVMRYSALTGAPRTTLTPTAVAKRRASRPHCAPRHGCDSILQHGISSRDD